MDSLLLRDIMTSPATCVDVNSTAADALGVMREKRISAVVITDRVDHAVGIVTERDAVLMAFRDQNPATTPVSHIMGKPPLSARPDMDYQDGYRLLARHGFRHLLVTDESDRLLGITTEGDFLNHLGNEFLVRFKDVGSLMTRGVLTMGPEDSTHDALELMTSKNISCVVVAEDNHPIGVFTERDLVKRYDAEVSLNQLVLREVMVQPVTCVHADQTLPDAMALMASKGIRRLLVTDNNEQIVGLITRHDIVKQLYDRQVQQLRAMLEEREQQLLETRKELQREKQFRAVMERLKTSQQVAHIGSWELDLTTHSLWWSDETFAIFDLQPEMGQPSYEQALEWLHPEDRQGFDEAYRLSLTCQTSMEHVFRLQTRRHHTRYVRVHFQTWLGDNSRPNRSVGTIQDITEHQLQRQQNDRTSALLNAVVHGSSDSIFIKDRQGRYLISNQGMADLLQMPISDILGKDDYALFPREVADQLTCADQRLIQEERFETFEEEVLLNGEPTPFLTTKGPVMVNDEVLGTFGIARDLRMVKEAEHERQQHHERLKAIFDTTTQLIGLLQPDGSVIDVNKTALAYFKLDPDHYRGLKFNEYPLWANNSEFQFHIRQAFEQANNGNKVCYKTALEHGDETDIIDFSLSPVINDSGDVCLLVAEGHIITAEVRARHKLAESEERYRSFVTHTKETVFSIEPDTPIDISQPLETQVSKLLQARLVTANEVMAQRYGYRDAEAMQGLTVEQLHIQSGCTDERFLQEWIERNYVFSEYTTRSEDQNGISSWYSNDLTAVIESGLLIRLWGTQTNISDRIMAENARNESEQLKRGILNSINAEIAVVNRNGNIITTNERWKNFHCAQCEDSCRIVCDHDGDQNYLDILKASGKHPKSTSYQAWQGIQQVLDQEADHFSLEYPCECDDAHRWFHMNVTPLPNAMVAITNVNITDRKFSELALQESEAHLQLALDAGGAGIWVWDVEHNKVFFDDRFARFFRIQSTEPVQIETIYQGIHHEDRQQARQDIEEALSHGKGYASEYRVVSEGRVRWISARGRIESGSPHDTSLRFSGVVLDITDRKRAEQALRSERDLQAQYLRTMQTLILVLDRDCRVVMANRATCELLGYSQSELMGRNWFETCLSGQDDVQQVLDVFRQIAGGNTQDYEYFENTITDRFGNSHLIAWNNAILHDAHGRPDGVLSSGQNITRQRQTENELRKNEQTLRTIFDQAGVGVALIDSATGNFLRVNHKYCAMLGYDRDELETGKSTWDLTHSCDVVNDKKQIRRLLAGDVSQYSLEKRYIHRNGSVVWVNLTATAVWETDEDPKQHITVVQDITARKKSEQQLLQAHRDWVQAMDQFDDAFYLIDMNRNLLRANAAFYRIINKTPDDCIGMPIEQLVHPHGEIVPCPVCQAQIHRQETTIVFEADDPNNPTDHPLEISVKLVRDQQDNPTAMLVAVRDLSRTREIRERLRLAGIVFDNTNEGIMVTDANSVVLEINQAFTDILGYERSEIIGQTPAILNSGRHDAAFYEQMWESLAATGQWRGEIWNRRKDGSILPEWQTITRVDDEHGHLAQYVAVFSDISQIKQSQEKLAHLAHHDPLTDLPNRLLLNERLERAISRAKRHNSHFTVMFLDIDNFKHINDSLGHPVGDQLLQSLATKLSSVVRCEDTVARVSGDEFVVILDQVANSDDAAQVARKLIDLAAQPSQLGDHKIAVTTSLGICIYPTDGSTPAELLRNADAAMYKAKEDGRDTFSFYDRNMTLEAFDRVMLENDLRQAIARNELFLVYQPQVNLNTGQCVGAEVLLRWHHSKLGFISPARFIPIAEDSGLIHEIGEWVLRTACEQGLQWLQQGLNIGRLAVNIAGPQLQRGNLVERVKTVLNDTGFPPEHLELEVTEGFIMKQADRAIDYLNELRAMDIDLAIDDFGTGHSSLSYLTQLPVHKLKIDQSFVRDVIENEQKQTIVNTVIVMGQSLGLTVIAEGVEEPEQAELLRQRRCHEAQGYLFSKPLSTDDAEAYFRNRLDN